MPPFKDPLDHHEAFRAAVFDDTDPDDEADEWASCSHQFMALTDEGIRCMDCGMSQSRIATHARSMEIVNRMAKGE